MDDFVIPYIPPNHSRLNRTLGKDWLESQVVAAQEASLRRQPLHPTTMSPAFGWVAHPLVEEAKNAAKNGRTPILDGLEVDLRNIDNIPLPKDLGSRLRNDQEFDKAAYELRIASGFCMLKYFLWWIPTVNWRHPEFVVLANKSDIVAAECKKRNIRDGYEQEGEKFWKHLQYMLRKEMEKASLNYWVKVTGRDFHLADIEALVSEVVSEMQTNENGQLDYSGGRYHVEYTELVAPDGSLPMEIINMFPRGAYGINIGKQKRDQVMVGPMQNPKLIRFEILDDPYHRVRGIIRNLSTAAKQVIKGLPNLVYIDVNLPEYEQEQSEFNDIVDAVRTELERRHRCISGVVLTNIYPALSLDEYLGWRVRTEYIAQPKPTCVLPQDFRFPGDIHRTACIRGQLAKSL
ncbi:MAG TPA: hypothetical protein G4O12_05765 [Dehalococcoidia bacterium]|nr:hypothetical protein [Dehalococcoidia bacterium]